LGNKGPGNKSLCGELTKEVGCCLRRNREPGNNCWKKVPVNGLSNVEELGPGFRGLEPIKWGL